ncbi:hypothetical protein Mgra_00000679 [Meloidogyne graminicola]|uniref:Uncharacterized protein n=1 Tax=Meloidogyne graminicola TaxID=189291 RepID=A0A8T0A1Q4_9BILA|nr:hypothetical protein Mgra_00000679 [Meloidogyne graminicola]
MSFNKTNKSSLNSTESLINRVKQFLPQIAAANAELEKQKNDDLVMIKRLNINKESKDKSEVSSDSSDTSESDSSDSDDEELTNKSIEKSWEFVEFDVHLFKEKETSEEKKLVEEVLKLFYFYNKLDTFLLFFR